MSMNNLGIKGQDKFILSDTLVPDIFIDEYMPRLSGEAVKCYLFLVSFGRRGNKPLTVADLARRLVLQKLDVERALQELTGEGLLQIADSGIHINDLKKTEIRRIISDLREHNSAPLSAKTISDREQVVMLVNNEYFQGTMNHRWYDIIDKWFNDYRFEPAVVQALFAEAATSDRWGVLTIPFLDTIAARWARNNVRTFAQLSEYYEKNEAFRFLFQHIIKVLRIPFTEPGMKMAEKWVEELGYSQDIIDLALEETTGSNNPNLRYVDAILRRWHEAGVVTVEDAKRQSREYRQSKRKGNISSSFSKSGSSNRGNYPSIDEERRYKENFFGLVFPGVEKRDSDASESC